MLVSPLCVAAWLDRLYEPRYLAQNTRYYGTFESWWTSQLALSSGQGVLTVRTSSLVLVVFFFLCSLVAASVRRPISEPSLQLTATPPRGKAPLTVVLRGTQTGCCADLSYHQPLTKGAFNTSDPTLRSTRERMISSTISHKYLEQI